MDVDLLSLVHDDEEAGHAADLAELAASVTVVHVPRLLNLARSVPALATRRPLTHVLLNSPQIHSRLREVLGRARPDVVFAYCSGMARFAVEPPLRRHPLVLDMVDVDSAKWAGLAQDSHLPKRWIFKREARYLRVFEGAAATHAITTLVVNERERVTLATYAPAERIRVLPNGVDIEGLRVSGPPTAEPLVTFCGVMNYAPNERGIEWFAAGVWSHVTSAFPNARLMVVGSDPSPRVQALAAADPSITVTGRVPDVRPFLWRSAVSIAPIHNARGVQNKVLEALAASLPCVVTSAVYGGLPTEARSGCLVADEADAYAKAIIDLLSMSPEGRRQFAEQADVKGLGWDAALAELPQIIDAASRSH
jgi:sugar transferase (PEP-CTERM/EpsH1 system associated)